MKIFDKYHLFLNSILLTYLFSFLDLQAIVAIVSKKLKSAKHILHLVKHLIIIISLTIVSLMAMLSIKRVMINPTGIVQSFERDTISIGYSLSFCADDFQTSFRGKKPIAVR